eukprot:COSAG02_NODE_64080_length_261_cov_0.956790_1_plen_79_part_10
MKRLLDRLKSSKQHSTDNASNLLLEVLALVHQHYVHVESRIRSPCVRDGYLRPRYARVHFLNLSAQPRSHRPFDSNLLP